MARTTLPVRPTADFGASSESIPGAPPQKWRKYEFDPEIFWANLPDPAKSGSRWYPHMKLSVVNAINLGQISREEFSSRYPDIKDEEYKEWEKGAKNGIEGLKRPKVRERKPGLE